MLRFSSTTLPLLLPFQLVVVIGRCVWMSLKALYSCMYRKNDSLTFPYYPIFYITSPTHLLISVVIVCALAEAHSPPSTSNATLLSSPPSSIQDLTDHNWVLLAHQIGLAQNPRFPFGAAIVDARSNALLCVSSNQMQNGHPRWSKFTAHGMYKEGRRGEEKIEEKRREEKKGVLMLYR